MTNQFDYPPGLEVEFVEIPESVLTFFRQRGKYVRLPREEGELAVTYLSIKGKQANGIPPEYSQDPRLAESTEEYPFENRGRRSREVADEATEQALRFIFGKGKFGDIRKAYMINTSTTPIKVAFSKEGKKSRDVLYAKKPDTNRIVGKYLYDTVVNGANSNWGFNRAIFLEEAISGNPLSVLDERVYLQSHSYKEGLVRAAVQSDFLGLHKDIKNHRNRIIDSEMRTHLFDFNIIFPKKEAGSVNFLLDPYLEDAHFFDDELMNTYRDEQHKIARRIDENHKPLFKFAKIVGQLYDTTNQTVDDRIRNFYGSRNLGEYIERRALEYRSS